MMWTTCFARAANGRDRVDDRDRALERHARPRCRPPRAARGRARRRGSRRELTPPPGRSQYSLPGFSWRQSRIRPRQRRIAETRMRGSAAVRAEEPKPRSPRSLPASSSTSTRLRAPDRDEHELRDAHAGLDHERLALVRVQEDDPKLAAVAACRRARACSAPSCRASPPGPSGEGRSLPSRPGWPRPPRSGRSRARPARARRARRRPGRGRRRPRTRAPGGPRPREGA